MVTVEDNYDRLGFDPTAITRDARYSRYVNPGMMLRSHTTAALPWLLAQMAPDTVSDELNVVPGLIYWRDSIDRTHVGEPHQVDLWRLSSTARLGPDDVSQMLAILVEAVLPGADWRAVPAEHPYTLTGRQLDVYVDGDWLELAECGLAAPDSATRSTSPYTKGRTPNSHPGKTVPDGDHKPRTGNFKRDERSARSHLVINA